MALRPLRRSPMMLGGVGFQAGLDEARSAEAEANATSRAAAPARDVVAQLKALQSLLDAGALTPEELQKAKRLVLDR